MNKYARNHVPARMFPFLSGAATMAELAKIAGVTVSCVSRRIKAGTPLARPSQSPQRTGCKTRRGPGAEIARETHAAMDEARNTMADELQARFTEPGSILTARDVALAAWDAALMLVSRGLDTQVEPPRNWQDKE